MPKEKEKTAYTQALSSGQYAVTSGLSGKYDNVRRFWEDDTTRRFLTPCIEKLLQEKEAENRQIRILDLGCGSGDGFETLMGLQKTNPELRAHEAGLLCEDRIVNYTGIDLNDGLLQQARERYANRDNISFVQGNLAEGLDAVIQEPGYDIYFSSFGTMSHFHVDETIKLFYDIARHARNGALLIGDWLGRYSYEWQDLWDNDESKEQWMDYRISYLYPADQRKSMDIASMPLRLVSRGEVELMVSKAAESSGAGITVKEIFDRSLMSGRHIDTGEYNGNPMPIRHCLNKLMEPSCRTDFRGVLFTYKSRDNFFKVNNLYEELAMEWNMVMGFAEQMLANAGKLPPPMVNHPDMLERCSSQVKNCVKSFEKVITASPNFTHGDVRAEIIEPQIAYILRELELSHQKGLGCGHGLAGIFEINK